MFVIVFKVKFQVNIGPINFYIYWTATRDRDNKSEGERERERERERESKREKQNAVINATGGKALSSEASATNKTLNLMVFWNVCR